MFLSLTLNLTVVILEFINSQLFFKIYPQTYTKYSGDLVEVKKGVLSVFKANF